MRIRIRINIGLIFALTLACVCLTAVFIPDKLNTGFDFTGGSEVLLRAPPEASARDVDYCVSIIKRRLSGSGITEPAVRADGDGRIIVRLGEYPLSADTSDILSMRAYLSFGVFDDNGDILVILDSAFVTGARYAQSTADTPGGQSRHYVIVKFNENGRKILSDATRMMVMAYPDLTMEKAQLTGDLRRNFAVLLDGGVISYPYVDAAVNSGEVAISGFSREQALRLELLINTGAMPVDLSIEDSYMTGPGIGDKFASLGFYSILTSLSLASILILFIYRVPGLVGIFATALSLSLSLALAVALDITITLSTAFGFALSLGLSFDFLIRINESIKEEIIEGKPVKPFFVKGFSTGAKRVAGAGLPLVLIALALAFCAEGSARSFAIGFSMSFIPVLLFSIVYNGFALLYMTNSGLLDKPAVSGWKAVKL